MKLQFIQVWAFTLIGLFSCNGQSPSSNKAIRQTISDFKMPFEATAKIPKAQGIFKDATIDGAIQDRAGNIWFWSNGEGIYRYDGKRFTHFTKKDGLCDSTVYALCEDRNGTIWVGTQKGLCRYDGKHFKPVSIISALNPPKPDNSVWSILEDKKGKLWFGTTDGVYCYKDGIFTHFSSDFALINPQTLTLNAIYCMLEDRKGNIWFATYSGDGLSRFDGKTLERIHPNDYKSIENIIEDQDGNIWFSDARRGICRYDGETFSDNILKEEKVVWHRLLWDKAKKHLWFNRPDELCQYDGTQINVFNTFGSGLPNREVYPIFSDKDGNIWITTPKMGLYHYNGNAFTRFSE